MEREEEWKRTSGVREELQDTSRKPPRRRYIAGAQMEFPLQGIEMEEVNAIEIFESRTFATKRDDARREERMEEGAMRPQLRWCRGDRDHHRRSETGAADGVDEEPRLMLLLRIAIL